MTAKTPTLPEFQQFAREIIPAVRAVLLAQCYAEIKREEVDAYIRPIFDRYTFPVRQEWATTYGETVKQPKDLYLTDAEDLTASFYEDCDLAHRAHGFDGPKGHCPALTAEHLQVVAESALLDLAEPIFGFESSHLYGENRKKALKLLIGAALNAAKDAGIEMNVLKIRGAA